MSVATRQREAWLPVFLLAVFLLLALGSGAAWPAVGGGHGGGHVGGFARGGHVDGGVSRGRELDGRRFGGRRHLDHGFFPYFDDYARYDGDDHADDDRYHRDYSFPRNPGPAICDVTHIYPQYCF